MAQANNSPLQGVYLNDLRKQRRLVQVYLLSGTRLSGLIVSFDQYVLMLEHRGETQVVYKHMIASIMPAPRSLSATQSTTTEQVILPEPIPVPVMVRKPARRALAGQE